MTDIRYLQSLAEGVGLRVGQGCQSQLFLQLHHLLLQFHSLFGLIEKFLTSFHQSLIFHQQSFVLLFQHLNLFLIIIFHLHTQILTSVQNILIFSDHVQLLFQIIDSS